jgi:hypothetical protein
MKKTTVRLEEQIHVLLEQIAAKRGLSLNHLINYALVRFVSFEEATQLLEERIRQARPGAMRRVLQKTAKWKGSPMSPEDERPVGFDRQVLERRLKREAALQRRIGT